MEKTMCDSMFDKYIIFKMMNCTDGHTLVNRTVAFMLTSTNKSHTLIYYHIKD